jgi:3-hydroxyisobutyrate dehydrogenase-like beta-hydroxyacid dehydrogenase
MSVKTTAMIGLGAMGYQMARHMVNKGYEVYGLDVNPKMNEQAAAVGVKIAASPAEIGAVADVVVVMVATDKQVEDVIVSSGMLDRMKKGSVICVASSCSVDTAKELETICNAKGIEILDTPVVLGQEACNNGTMTVFCGGKDAAFEKAKPVMQCFGSNVMHVGAAGMGQLTKTINNMLLWACMSANFEALTFAKKMGADIPKMIDALQFSSGANWSLSRWGKSTGKWAEKDMDVALDLAQQAKCAVPLAALVDQLMKGMNQEKMKQLMS